MTLPDRIKGKTNYIECVLYSDNLVLWTLAPRNRTDKMIFKINQSLKALRG